MFSIFLRVSREDLCHLINNLSKISIKHDSSMPGLSPWPMSFFWTHHLEGSSIFLVWKGESSLPLKRLLQSQLMETRHAWILAFQLGYSLSWVSTLNSGMSCASLCGWCARLVFSRVVQVGNVNINWIGYHFEISIGKLFMLPLQLLN